jgi:hypothetical protein
VYGWCNLKGVLTVSCIASVSACMDTSTGVSRAFGSFANSSDGEVVQTSAAPQAALDANLQDGTLIVVRSLAMVPLIKWLMQF